MQIFTFLYNRFFSLPYNLNLISKVLLLKIHMILWGLTGAVQTLLSFVLFSTFLYSKFNLILVQILMVVDFIFVGVYLVVSSNLLSISIYLLLLPLFIRDLMSVFFRFSNPNFHHICMFMF